MDLIPPQFENAEKLSLGIISDTHGLLRPEASSALLGSDVILHLGDVGNEAILDQLELIAPVYAVRGNVDYQSWCGRLPDVLTLRLGGLGIYMIHDISHLDRVGLKDVSLVVHGQSHRSGMVEEDGVVFVNPGSAGPRRFSLPVTVATLQWERGRKNLQPMFIHLTR